MNVLKTTLATLALAATLPAHAGLLVDGRVEAPTTVIAMPAGIEASAIAMQDQAAATSRTEDPFAAFDRNADARANRTTIAGVTYRIHFATLATAEVPTPSGAIGAPSPMRLKALDPDARPKASLDQVRVTAVPDPGTLQVFGLGLVILATVAGTQRRKSV